MTLQSDVLSVIM